MDLVLFPCAGMKAISSVSVFLCWIPHRASMACLSPRLFSKGQQRLDWALQQLSLSSESEEEVLRDVLIEKDSQRVNRVRQAINEQGFTHSSSHLSIIHCFSLLFVYVPPGIVTVTQKIIDCWCLQSFKCNKTFPQTTDGDTIRVWHSIPFPCVF